MRTRRSFGATSNSTPLFFAFSPSFQLRKQFVGVRLDLLTFEGGDRGNDKLNAGFSFKIGELRLNSAARVGRDDVRLIDDTTRERRKIDGEAATTVQTMQ